jgi:Tol biopolymer transport system component
MPTLLRTSLFFLLIALGTVVLAVAIGRSQPRGEQLMFGIARFPNADILWADVDKWIIAPLMRTHQTWELLPVWSTDGSQLYYYRETADELRFLDFCVLTLKTKTTVCTPASNDLKFPSQFIPSPSGSKVIVRVSNGSLETYLYLWDPMGQSITLLAIVPFGVISIDWRLDGVSLYLAGSNVNFFRIDTIAVELGSVPTTLFEMPLGGYSAGVSPSLSPNLQTFAVYITNSDSYPELQFVTVMDLAANSPRWVSFPELDMRIGSFAWSPNSNAISYLKYNPMDSRSNIFTIDLLTGSVRQWTTMAMYFGNIDYSPDGHFLSYTMMDSLNQNRVTSVCIRSLIEGIEQIELFHCSGCGVSPPQWRPR